MFGETDANRLTRRTRARSITRAEKFLAAVTAQSVLAIPDAPQGQGRPMSTPNPYSHPSFFPTHAIVPKKTTPPLHPSRLPLTYRWGNVVVITIAAASACRTMRSQESARAR